MHRLELGAQLVIYRKGEVVVDLCGAAPEAAGYTPETLQCVYSSGKNMEAVAVAMLVDRGQLSYESPVAHYWPEYGQHGKDNITVADVMRHEGGVPYLADPDAPADRFEKEELDWHQRLRENFLDIARNNADRCVVISAEQDEEALEAAIWEVVSSRFPELQGRPVA